MLRCTGPSKVFPSAHDRTPALAVPTSLCAGIHRPDAPPVRLVTEFALSLGMRNHRTRRIPRIPRLAALASLAAVAVVAGCDTHATGFASLPINDNPSLASLTASAGSLNPTFSATRTAFNLTVPDSVGQISVTPTAAAATSRVLVSGQEVVSGSLSAPITLNDGVTAIPVTVTAQSGTTRTYTIAVVR